MAFRFEIPDDVGLDADAKKSVPDMLEDHGFRFAEKQLPLKYQWQDMPWGCAVP